MKKQSNISISEQQYTGKILKVPNASAAISISKTAKVLANMDRYLIGSEEGKFLSPTSLTTYITCPLRFYFQYVLRIREHEDLEEDIDARNFGIVVHRALELLYLPWLGIEITSQDVKGLEKAWWQKKYSRHLKKRK